MPTPSTGWWSVSRAPARGWCAGPGERMPPFACRTSRGVWSAWTRYCDGGPLAITFHRGHWCPWCRISGRRWRRRRTESSARRQAGRDHAGAAEFRRRSSRPRPARRSRCSPIRTTAMPCRSVWRSGSGPIWSGCSRHTAGCCRSTRAATRGCCRSRRRSWWVRMGWYARASSIRISAGGSVEELLTAMREAGR